MGLDVSSASSLHLSLDSLGSVLSFAEPRSFLPSFVGFGFHDTGTSFESQQSKILHPDPMDLTITFLCQRRSERREIDEELGFGFGGGGSLAFGSALSFFTTVFMVLLSSTLPSGGGEAELVRRDERRELSRASQF